MNKSLLGKFLISGLVIAIVLFLFMDYNYLLYHSLVELMGITVAFTVFSIGWHTRNFAGNDLLLFLAVAYLAVGTVDLLHLLSYEGMGVFPGHGVNLPTQLWIGARFIEGISLLLGVILYVRKVEFRPQVLMCCYAAVVVALLLSIFMFDVFPACFIEGEGLTAFKVTGEYVICLLLGAAGLLLWKYRGSIDKAILTPLLIAIGVTIAAELSFTLYNDIYGIFNFAGHLLKTVSIIFIYVGLVRGALVTPYNFLFLDLENELSHRKKAENTVNYLSYYDTVTGLHNRNYFEEKIKQLDNEEYLPLSLIMGDVNGLKLVNDAFGHLEGDKLLKSIAEKLCNTCRRDDVIARWGGDEFVILLANTPYEEAEEIYRHIKDSCRGTENTPIPPSIAMGLATKENPGQNIYDVLKKAEDTMYRNKLIEGKSFRSSIFVSLKEVLQKKELETPEHVQRTKTLARQIGEALELSGEKLEELDLLAAYHDIGMIGIDEYLHWKDGAFSAEEKEKIKKHSQTGYNIARSSPELAHIANLILYHHERWDGKGYPEGLKGEDIPLNSRIMAVVDFYDKTTDREKALEELKKRAGKQFDPHIIEVFIEKVC